MANHQNKEKINRTFNSVPLFFTKKESRRKNNTEPHLNRLCDFQFLGNFCMSEPLAASSKIAVKKIETKQRTAI